MKLKSKPPVTKRLKLKCDILLSISGIKFNLRRYSLVYEANPLAFVAAACGGAASDGHDNILSKVPQALHQRVPLFVGSVDDIAEVEGYGAGADTRPLFSST
jgi:hypothetical protein